MKAFTICTAMAIFALSHATPFGAKPRQSYTEVTFEGAPPDDAYFTQSFPVDGTTVFIYNPLSISHIQVTDGVFCTFDGIDGSVTVVQGPDTVDVGPPQTQLSGYCIDFVE